jgi:hypothetical protein
MFLFLGIFHKRPYKHVPNQASCSPQEYGRLLIYNSWNHDDVIGWMKQYMIQSMIWLSEWINRWCEWLHDYKWIWTLIFLLVVLLERKLDWPLTNCKPWKCETIGWYWHTVKGFFLLVKFRQKVTYFFEILKFKWFSRFSITRG